MRRRRIGKGNKAGEEKEEEEEGRRRMRRNEGGGKVSWLTVGVDGAVCSVVGG